MGPKQFGTLFCYDQISRGAAGFWEMGVGLNRFFDQHLDQAVDYWVVDTPGFYDPAKYRHSTSLRRRTTLVDGLVGDFLVGLPSEGFDVIFSTSSS